MKVGLVHLFLVSDLQDNKRFTAMVLKAKAKHIISSESKDLRELYPSLVGFGLEVGVAFLLHLC